MATSVNEVNRRINILREKAKRGKASTSELNELRHSLKLVGEVAERAIAVPAAQFTDYSSWANQFNDNGDVPEIVTDDSAGNEPPATKDESPDGEGIDNSIALASIEQQRREGK